MGASDCVCMTVTVSLIFFFYPRSLRPLPRGLYLSLVMSFRSKSENKTNKFSFDRMEMKHYACVINFVNCFSSNLCSVSRFWSQCGTSYSQHCFCLWAYVVDVWLVRVHVHVGTRVYCGISPSPIVRKC